MSKACAVHILVKTRAEADKLLQQIRKGKNFSQLAKQHSLCPSGKKDGGNLGEFRRGQMVKQFDDVVFKKPVLEYHGPVKTKFGYHIIKTLYRS